MAANRLLGSRYEVLRTVSEGRRASVLQALDLVHDRLVALKVYPVTDETRDAMLAEARLLMSITPHPALPVVRGDLFTDEGDRYVVVMNWVDGTDLEQLLEDEGDPGLPLQEVMESLQQVAAALDHLHAHVPPVVHGDVKPANLIRADTGHVALVDFDIAGADAESGRVGTIGFVAPEVAAGAKPGPEADVFGLAATAVTLLNGVPPNEAVPTYPGVEPPEKGHVARVLRAALASDPARRPRSAGRLVANLGSALRGELPSGVVALLAAEVADSGRLWREDAGEMRVAMMRLRDVRDEVVDHRGGRVVSSMNEGDRTIAVFHEASAAALAALDMHDRLAAERFPPGFDVRVRIAVAVGDAVVADGAYTGAVVDQVLGLRSAADPGTTITSESTGELLLGMVGRDVSIVPLGRIVIPALPEGTSVFGLTRPGAEHTARTVVAERADAHAASPVAISAGVGSATPRRTVIVDALQHWMTLIPVVLAGLAAIYLLVLSPELGFAALAAAVLVLGVVAAVASFGWLYRFGDAARQRRRETDIREHGLERAVSRARLETRIAQLEPEVAGNGRRLLEGLGDEFEAISDLLRRDAGVPANLSVVLPDLAEQTYQHGVSAVSDAVELFQFADGQQHRRLLIELRDVEQRLAWGRHTDDVERLRDEQRRDSRRELLGRHAEAHQRAGDLMFEAERCVAALAEARVELASPRNDEVQVDASPVIHTLQATIHHVREVQDELRRLGYSGPARVDDRGRNLMSRHRHVRDHSAAADLLSAVHASRLAHEHGDVRVSLETAINR